MTSWHRTPLIASLALLGGCSGVLSGGLPAATRPIDTQRLAVFTPKPDGRKTTIDFTPMDEVFGDIVLVTGPSLRKRASLPRKAPGTRIPRGHTSAVRLEGNKVIFSILNDAAKDLVYKLTDATVAAGNRIELTALRKNEQLAYWLNLHNLLVISTILKHYPAASPSKLTVGDPEGPFHDAPLVVIKGVPLSLRDIRIGIVYRHWDDPRVMYGFFHGDLASPNMRAQAWTGDDVWPALDANAKEFVNALRGVRKSYTTLLVSPLYQEAREGLFPNWPADLRNHISQFAQEKVAQVLAETTSVDFSRYEHRTADLVGGQDYLPTSPVAATAVGPAGYAAGTDRMYLYPLSSPNFGLTYGEFARKFRDLKRAGKQRFTPTVEIIDLKSDSDDKADDKAPKQTDDKK